MTDTTKLRRTLFQSYDSYSGPTIIRPSDRPQGCCSAPPHLCLLPPCPTPAVCGTAPHVSWKQPLFSGPQQILEEMTVAFRPFCADQLAIRKLQRSPASG